MSSIYFTRFVLTPRIITIDGKAYNVIHEVEELGSRIDCRHLNFGEVTTTMQSWLSSHYGRTEYEGISLDNWNAMEKELGDLGLRITLEKDRF